MNVVNIIEIYKWNGYWVFDDPNVGLVHEGLVMGTDTIIDYLVQDIPNADAGFMCMFSGKPLPEYTVKFVLSRRGNDEIGNWYTAEGTNMEGWLCPALYKYFEKEPDCIWIKIDPKK